MRDPRRSPRRRTSRTDRAVRRARLGTRAPRRHGRRGARGVADPGPGPRRARLPPAVVHRAPPGPGRRVERAADARRARRRSGRPGCARGRRGDDPQPRAAGRGRAGRHAVAAPPRPGRPGTRPVRRLRSGDRRADPPDRPGVRLLRRRRAARPCTASTGSVPTPWPCSCSVRPRADGAASPPGRAWAWAWPRTSPPRTSTGRVVEAYRRAVPPAVRAGGNRPQVVVCLPGRRRGLRRRGTVVVPQRSAAGTWTGCGPGDRRCGRPRRRTSIGPPVSGIGWRRCSRRPWLAPRIPRGPDCGGRPTVGAREVMAMTDLPDPAATMRSFARLAELTAGVPVP